MASVKTAVSLDRSLFEEVDALAREMNTSRSHVVVLALEEFIRRHENKQLLARINKAYDSSTVPERALQHRMRQQHRRVVEGEW